MMEKEKAGQKENNASEDACVREGKLPLNGNSKTRKVKGGGRLVPT